MDRMKPYGLPLLGASVVSLVLSLSFATVPARADACTERECTYWSNDIPSSKYCEKKGGGGSICDNCNGQYQSACIN